jgi:hypothetical protein
MKNVDVRDSYVFEMAANSPSRAVVNTENPNQRFSSYVTMYIGLKLAHRINSRGTILRLNSAASLEPKAKVEVFGCLGV